MDFTVDQLEKAINELDAGRYCSGDSDVIGMLRAFAARLREDDANAKDAARYRWWRENWRLVEEDEAGVAGAAFSCQVDTRSIESATAEELFDLVADAATRAASR